MVFVKGALTSITLAIAAITSVVSVPVHQKLDRRQDKGDDSNGLTDLVTWDTYTLKVNDERLFLFSGEFHVSQ